MATYNTPLVTTQGLALLKAEIAGNDSVTFTKIVFSSDDYSQTADSSVQALTALSSLDLTATARSFTDVNGNLKIRGVANNQNTTSAFYIKTYGLYGKNKAGNEMLIAVSTAQNANFVPAYNNKQTNQIAYTFNIAISSTNNITLSSSTDVDVTQADLAGINNAVNSNASSLTAQQSSYASSLNSAFSANSSNASSYVSSASSSLQSQVSSYAGSIATNSSAISELQTNAVQFIGNVPTAKLEDIPNDGIYNLDGGSFPDAPVTPIYGVLIQTGSGIGVKAQRIINNLGNVYYRAINGWGIKGWYQVSTEDDISSINSSLASMASQTSNISSSVSANSNAIANNVTNIGNVQSKVNVNTTDISANATSIATNSSAISNLQSSVATNSSAISSNASEISSNATAISVIGSQATTAINTAMNGLQYRGVWQGGYGSWGGKPDGIYTIDNGQNPIDGFFVDVAKQFTGYGVMTLTTSASGLDRYCIIQDNINQVFKQHLITSTGVYTGWTRLSDNSNSLQYMGNLPSTHLANITQTGIYNMGGIEVDDGPYPIQWGQLAVLNTGGVINQTIHDSSGTLFTRSINSWGIVGWNTNKH